MRLAIDHVTTYHFAGPVRQGLQRLRLTPLTGPGQMVTAWDIECEGGGVEASYDDEHTNRVTLIGIAPSGTAVTIRAHGGNRDVRCGGRIRAPDRAFADLAF